MNGDKSGEKLSRPSVFSSVFFRFLFPFLYRRKWQKSEKEIDKQSSHSASRFLKGEKKCCQFPHSSLPDARAQRDQAKCRSPPSIPSVMPRSTRVSACQCRLIE